MRSSVTSIDHGRPRPSVPQTIRVQRARPQRATEASTNADNNTTNTNYINHRVTQRNVEVPPIPPRSRPTNLSQTLRPTATGINNNLSTSNSNQTSSTTTTNATNATNASRPTQRVRASNPGPPRTPNNQQINIDSQNRLFPHGQNRPRRMQNGTEAVIQRPHVTRQNEPLQENATSGNISASTSSVRSARNNDVNSNGIPPATEMLRRRNAERHAAQIAQTQAQLSQHVQAANSNGATITNLSNPTHATTRTAVSAIPSANTTRNQPVVQQTPTRSNPTHPQPPNSPAITSAPAPRQLDPQNRPRNHTNVITNETNQTNNNINNNRPSDNIGSAQNPQVIVQRPEPPPRHQPNERNVGTLTNNPINPNEDDRTGLFDDLFALLDSFPLNLVPLLPVMFETSFGPFLESVIPLYLAHVERNQLIQALDESMREAANPPPEPPKKVKLITHIINKDDTKSLKDCAVCLCDFTAGESTVMLKCGHLFHKNCLMPWFLEHHTCPTCRANIDEGEL